MNPLPALHLDWWELGPRPRGGGEGGAGGGGGGEGVDGFEEDIRSWRGGERHLPTRSLLSSLSVRTLPLLLLFFTVMVH
jgi:hypothetical protein